MASETNGLPSESGQLPTADFAGNLQSPIVPNGGQTSSSAASATPAPSLPHQIQSLRASPSTWSMVSSISATTFVPRSDLTREQEEESQGTSAPNRNHKSAEAIVQMALDDKNNRDNDGEDPNSDEEGDEVELHQAARAQEQEQEQDDEFIAGALPYAAYVDHGTTQQSDNQHTKEKKTFIW